MAMTKAEMDEFDRRIMGIMDPRAATPAPVSYQPSPLLNDPEGRPLTREYSLDDIRRFLGFGSRPAMSPAMSPAEAADAAQMYERVPNTALPPTPPRDYDAPSPSIPPMLSTDPRGAAAPIPAPPVPAVSRAAGARPMGRPGPMPAMIEAMPMSGIVPVPTAGAAPMTVEAMQPPVPPVPLANRNRVDPQMLARALMRGSRPPIGNEMAALPPGSEMQVGPAPMGGMPVEAQADQTMRSVSRVNPQSFGNRFRGVMTR